jgi:hypothetical protein
MVKLRAVLADINQDVRDGSPHYFSIRYVKADGSIGQKARVRKSGQFNGAEIKGESHFKYNVKQKGILVLFDEATNRHFSIKISRITHYNGQEVWH